MTAMPKAQSQLVIWARNILYGTGAVSLIVGVFVLVVWGSHEAMTWTANYVHEANWPVYPILAGLIAFFAVMMAGLTAAFPVIFIALALLGGTDLASGLAGLKDRRSGQKKPPRQSD